MKNFYPEIILLALVAIFALLFMGGVFEPQKNAQNSMAEAINQTTTSVRAGVDDTAPIVVTADSVITTVNQYCKPTSSITITVTVGVTTNTYTTATTSSTGIAITTVVSDLSKYYTKKVTKDGNGVITDIIFIQQ